MKKRIRTIFSLTLLFCMVLASSVRAESERVRQWIYLYKNQMWTTSFKMSRTMKNSYTEVNLYSVYPTDNSNDNYQKIRAVVRANNIRISDIVTLNETDGLRRIELKDGYLDCAEILFAFSGNNPKYDAYADVFYDAK